MSRESEIKADPMTAIPAATEEENERDAKRWRTLAEITSRVEFSGDGWVITVPLPDAERFTNAIDNEISKQAKVRE